MAAPQSIANFLFWAYDFPVESIIIREPRFGRFVDSKGSSTLPGFGASPTFSCLHPPAPAQLMTCFHALYVFSQAQMCC